jgi:hypothetical protein
LDDAWGEPTEEPYVREVKVVTPAANDPPVEPGLALVEMAPGQGNVFFKESESGSPVFNMDGLAVAIMIQKRTDEASGLARRGIALPFATVADWLNGVRQDPVKEPIVVALADFAKDFGKIDDRTDFLTSIADSCMFLGKYSARNRPPNDDSTLVDAPLGIPYLKKVISYFPEAVPDQLSDQDAVLTRQLAEPESLSIPQRSAVRIRAYCPNVVPKPKRAKASERFAYYGPEIARADSSFVVRIKRVQREAYLDDFFYWGEIQSVSRSSP